MDKKFYKEAANCWEENVAEFPFPKAGEHTFAAQNNSQVIGDTY